MPGVLAKFEEKQKKMRAFKEASRGTITLEQAEEILHEKQLSYVVSQLSSDIPIYRVTYRLKPDINDSIVGVSDVNVTIDEQYYTYVAHGDSTGKPFNSIEELIKSLQQSYHSNITHTYKNIEGNRSNTSLPNNRYNMNKLSFNGRNHFIGAGPNPDNADQCERFFRSLCENDVDHMVVAGNPGQDFFDYLNQNSEQHANKDIFAALKKKGIEITSIRIKTSLHQYTNYYRLGIKVDGRTSVVDAYHISDFSTLDVAKLLRVQNSAKNIAIHCRDGLGYTSVITLANQGSHPSSSVSDVAGFGKLLTDLRQVRPDAIKDAEQFKTAIHLAHTMHRIQNSSSEEKNKQALISLKEDLERYTSRVRSHSLESNSNEINFAHGFWVFASSRAKNRMANLMLANKLLAQIKTLESGDKVDEINDVASIISNDNIKNIRKSDKHCQLSTMGIFSTSELHSILEKARQPGQVRIRKKI